jgi:hypothetical protein
VVVLGAHSLARLVFCMLSRIGVLLVLVVCLGKT